MGTLPLISVSKPASQTGLEFLKKKEGRKEGKEWKGKDSSSEKRWPTFSPTKKILTVFVFLFVAWGIFVVFLAFFFL
jgi:hypothetical protein